MKKQELEEKYPGVADAVEREYPGSDDTIENISGVDLLASTNSGAFVYYVSAAEDFYVIEGETGSGLKCKECANKNTAGVGNGWSKTRCRREPHKEFYEIAQDGTCQFKPLVRSRKETDHDHN